MKTVLVTVKLTSRLYVPEEFWRLTKKKKKIFYTPFKNGLGKENKHRWCADPISLSIENYRKLYYRENSFHKKNFEQIWSFTTIWKQEAMWCNSRMSPGQGLFEVLWGKQRKPESGLEPLAPVGISQHSIQIIPPHTYKSPEKYQNREAWNFP